MASPTSSGVELIEHQIDPSASGKSTFEAAWQGLRDRMGERAGLKPPVADTLGRTNGANPASARHRVSSGKTLQ